jgi:hypothetical protein
MLKETSISRGLSARVLYLGGTAGRSDDALAAARGSSNPMRSRIIGS